MKRLFYSTLENWLTNNSKTPLMIVGARQTGKTYLINKFCEDKFKSYVYINLELEENIKSIFDETLNPEEIIKYIKIIKNINFNETNTIIFLDEIQVSERAITSLKYFCESKTHYKIITAGSLLGVRINRFNSSFPVGKVIIKHIFPMNF